MITSNLKAVIARLEQYQAGLPGCVDRALDRKFWLKWLRARAAAALAHQFTLLPDPAQRDRYQARLPEMLDRLSAVVTPGLAAFTFGIRPEVATDVNLAAAAQYAELSWSPTGRARKNALPDHLAMQNHAAAKQAILDWVTFEKQHDERDAGLSNEQIAERMEVILGLRPSLRDQTQEMRAAAENLTGAINAWLAGDPVTPSGGHDVKSAAPDPARNVPGARAAGTVNHEMVRQWLDAVLQTWVVNFRPALRDRLRAELKKLRAKVSAAQPELV